MAENSKISWTHDTQNWWVGCTKCGPECQHCYIIRELRKQQRRWNEAYLTKTWNDPRKWQRELNGTGEYKRVFTNSLSDFFDRRADKRLVPEERMYVRFNPPALTWRSAAWSVIRNTPNLVYLILTKRPHRIVECVPPDWGQGYPNVWLGTSVGCNQTLHRIDHLRRVPVHPEAVRFLSCEPLLEDIAPNINLDGIGWVICGGESGDGEEYLWTPDMKWKPKDFPGRRTMKLDWAWALRTKAKEHGLPFCFKQITAPRAGQGEEVFGRVIHEVPNPPNGGVWYVAPQTSHAAASGPLVPAETEMEKYAKRDEETQREKLKPAKPRTKLRKPSYREGVDFDSAFLIPTGADELFELMKTQPFADNRVSYGPQVFPPPRKSNAWKDRYALATNPQSEPTVIQALRLRLSEKYGVPFNSVQCNWHAGNSEVKAHYDPYRVVAMIRLGATRTFEVGDQRRNGGQNFKPYPMPHGSLITFLSGGLAHRMFPDPATGDCVSLVFRLVTPPQTVASWHDKPNYSKTRAAHKKLYDAAVSDFRSAFRFPNGGAR